jgi:hypothetical protein
MSKTDDERAVDLNRESELSLRNTLIDVALIQSKTHWAVRSDVVQTQGFTGEREAKMAAEYDDVHRQVVEAGAVVLVSKEQQDKLHDFMAAAQVTADEAVSYFIDAYYRRTTYPDYASFEYQGKRYRFYEGIRFTTGMSQEPKGIAERDYDRAFHAAIREWRIENDRNG